MNSEAQTPRPSVADLKIELDIENLEVGHIIDLEEARSAGQICAWLVDHAGQELAVLRRIPAREMMDLGQALKIEVQKALDPNSTKTA